MTITEALAEIKLIEKKVVTKENHVLGHLWRMQSQPDILGDSDAELKKEIQSVSDLRKRWVEIRKAIAVANSETKIAIDGEEKTILEWLSWKREIAPNELQFHHQVHNRVKAKMDEIASRPSLFRDQKEDNVVKLDSLKLNVDYSLHVTAASKVQEVLDKLDGQLSLKNATIQLPV